MNLKSIEILSQKRGKTKPILLFSLFFLFAFFLLGKNHAETEEESLALPMNQSHLPLELENLKKKKNNTKDLVRKKKGSLSFFHFYIGGSFFQDRAFLWGDVREQKKVGQMTAGLTYRPRGKRRISDFQFRGDLISFNIKNQKITKISFLPLFFTLPSLDSQFPVYAGLGGGLGAFLKKQLYDESYFSLDYQLVAGFRLFEILENIGAIFEVGYKNHFFLFNNGGHRALYVSLGLLFGL